MALDTDTCQDCGTVLTAENVWEPGTCKACVPEEGSEKWHYNFCQAGLQTIYVVMGEGHGHQIGCRLCNYRGPVIPCD